MGVFQLEWLISKLENSLSIAINTDSRLTVWPKIWYTQKE